MTPMLLGHYLRRLELLPGVRSARIELEVGRPPGGEVEWSLCVRARTKSKVHSMRVTMTADDVRHATYTERVLDESYKAVAEAVCREVGGDLPRRRRAAMRLTRWGATGGPTRASGQRSRMGRGPT